MALPGKHISREERDEIMYMYLSGLSYRTIAAITRVSCTTISTRLHGLVRPREPGIKGLTDLATAMCAEHGLVARSVRQINWARRDEAVRFVQEGVSLRQIAKELGISRYRLTHQLDVSGAFVHYYQPDGSIISSGPSFGVKVTVLPTGIINRVSLIGGVEPVTTVDELYGLCYDAGASDEELMVLFNLSRIRVKQLRDHFQIPDPFTRCAAAAKLMWCALEMKRSKRAKCLHVRRAARKRLAELK